MSNSDNAKSKLLDSMRISKDGPAETTDSKPAAKAAPAKKAAPKKTAAKKAAPKAKKAAPKAKKVAASADISPRATVSRDGFQSKGRCWPD